jgi:OPT oligopeptide transporter protein
VLTFPICKAWARYLPNVSLFGIPLNPGPFTIKEHVIITIMAGVGAASAYAVSVTSAWQIMSAPFFCSKFLQHPLDRYNRRSESIL